MQPKQCVPYFSRESTFGRARKLSCELRKGTVSQPGHSGTSPVSRSPVLPESRTNLRADFRKRFQEVGKGWLENITDFKNLILDNYTTFTLCFRCATQGNLPLFRPK